MIECPNCKRENEDTYRYCLGCGGVLPQLEDAGTEGSQSQACSSCGIDVPPNFKFCGACGTPVLKSSMRVASAIPTAPAISDVSANPPIDQKIVGQKTIAGHLIVIKPDGTEGAKIPIDGKIILGRTSDYEVLKNDPFLSPKHATITPDGKEFVVKDLESLNGVFLRIKGETELEHEDQIRIGQELLVFQDIAKVNLVIAPTNDDTQTHGSPSPKTWGRLSLIAGPEVESRAFTLDSDEVILGREVGKVLFREDGFVSGKHARVSRVEKTFFLKDLGSSNGTYLRMKTERRVANGDLILMGQQLFRLDA